MLSLNMAACTSGPNQDLMLFNNLKFKMHEEEQAVEIDNDTREQFAAYFDDLSVQIPLYRCITGRNYTVFIGIPLNAAISELARQNLADIFNPTVFAGDSVTFLYKKYRGENEVVSIYSKNFDRNRIFILASTNSAELSDSLFNIKALSDRIVR